MKIQIALIALLIFLNQNRIAAQITVFQNGEEGFKCYRIPAIVKAPNGDLLAFCEARKLTCSDHGDVRIVQKRSSDNGKTWGKLEEVASNGNDQLGNPAPVVDLADKKHRNGRIFLFYNTGTASEQEVREGKAIREIWYKTSTDNGKTWSVAVNITPSVSKPKMPSMNPAYNFTEDWRSYANTPGHGLQLTKGRNKGRIFIAANHSEGSPQKQFRDYRAHGFYTDNHGKTWKITPNITYPSSNESTAAELSKGGIFMNSRNQSGDVKRRISAWSKNGGKSWDEIKIDNQLLDPVCQGSVLNFKTKNGKELILFSNLEHETKRENLTLKWSDDDGRTWHFGKVIYAGSSAYSDLVMQSDGRLGILFEKDNYTKIEYVQLEEADFLKK